MFKDMSLSKELHNEFVGSDANKTTGIDLASIQILTNGNWPIEDYPTCTIPKLMTGVSEKFLAYYNRKFNNRKLKWLH